MEKPLSRPNLLSMLVVSLALMLVIACNSESPEVSVPEDTAVLEEPTAVEEPAVLENQLVRLVDPLDDPGHYCIDIPGFGPSVRLQAPLQAHTCKPTDNRDEQFTFTALTGQLRTEEYELCAEPETLTDGSDIYLRDCSDAPLQRFTHLEDGTIRPTGEGSSSLCVAVAPGPV